MNIALYTGFSKDINSTKRPTTESAIVADCTIFEPCSILHPSFILSAGGDAIYRNATYCYVPLWGRYYWVTDRQFIDGRFIITCDIDVLATYKVNISASLQFVLRAESKTNPLITDTAYPLNGETVDTVVPMSNLENPFTPNLANGSFIVGIVGEADSNVARFGAVNYYQFSMAQFTAFITALMSNDNDWLDVQNSDLSDSTVKMILNPMQYITSCMWFPVSPDGTDTSSDIKFGWWNISGITHKNPPSTGGYPNTTGLIGFNSLAKHSQAPAGGSYLNRQPFSSYRLYMPQAGFIDIPSDVYDQAEYIGVEYKIDLASGNMVLDIYAYDDEFARTKTWYIARSSVKVGIDVPIAQLATDIVGTVQSGIGTLGSGISGAVSGFSSGGVLGAIAGAIGGLIGGAIDTSVKAATPIANILPSTGALSGYFAPPQIICTFKLVCDEVPGIIGKPLCAPIQIAELSGFVQCATSHIAISNATKTEIEQIETYLREGFYYE